MSSGQVKSITILSHPPMMRSTQLVRSNTRATSRFLLPRTIFSMTTRAVTAVTTMRTTPVVVVRISIPVGRWMRVVLSLNRMILVIFLAAITWSTALSPYLRAMDLKSRSSSLPSGCSEISGFGDVSARFTGQERESGLPLPTWSCMNHCHGLW